MRKSRKFFLIVALTLIACFALASLAGCTPTANFDVVKSEGDYGDTVFSQLKYLAENYPDRTMATQGEIDASRYLANTLSDLGYEGVDFGGDEAGLQSFTLDYTRYDGTSKSKATAYNVVFTKKSENSKGEILLSAQYDNLYGEGRSTSANDSTNTNTQMTAQDDGAWKADGSYESGSAIAVMLTLAQLLSDVDCGYDITFAFFTGGSYYWQGAYYYVSHLKNVQVENIRLMLNFSMLGGGDNLYLYAREKSTDYGAYLADVSAGLTQLPKDRNATSLILETDPLYAFSHIGIVGNHYYFMNRGVPTANYLSLNWSLNDYPFITEMSGRENVYHTADDTFANMVARMGEDKIKSGLNDVVNSVLGALDTANANAFEQVLDTAREQCSVTGQSSRTSSYVEIALKICVVAVFFAIALTVRNYVRKNRDKYIADEESEKENDVQPFDFSGYPKDGGESGESKKSVGGGQKPPSDDPFI